jgi:hypothetical protein
MTPSSSKLQSGIFFRRHKTHMRMAALIARMKTLITKDLYTKNENPPRMNKNRITPVTLVFFEGKIFFKPNTSP